MSTCFLSSTMEYILYARKSSEDDERQIQSITDQQSVLRKLAQQLDLEISMELVEAHSAKEPGTRPIFSQMVKLIERGKAKGILCWNISRLFRNPVDQGTIAWLLQTGVLESIRTNDREYLPTDNVLMLAFEGGMATQYVIDLSKSVKRGLHEKALRGWLPGKARPGYLNVQEQTNGILMAVIRPDPNGFVLMRRAWDLMLTGAYTVSEVREKLAQWGYRTPKSKVLGGKPIALSALYYALGDPMYYGWFRYNGELHKGNHQPMVTKEEFDHVQTVLGRKSDKPTHSNKHDFAFTGLIRCGICGCQVTATRKIKYYKTTNRTCEYVYYHCNGYKQCPKISITEREIEDRLRRLLARCHYAADFTPWITNVLSRDKVEQPKTLDVLLDRHKKRLRDGQNHLQQLYKMRFGDEIDADEFKGQKNLIMQEIVSLEGAIGRLSKGAESNKQTTRNLTDFLETAYNRFTEGQLKNKREVAQALGLQVHLDQRPASSADQSNTSSIAHFRTSERAIVTGSRQENGAPNSSFVPSLETDQNSDREWRRSLPATKYAF